MPGLIMSEHLSAMCPIDFETVPFWASLSSGFGWFWMTTPQCTFSCLVHSHLPKRCHHPVWQLCSLLPAFDPRLPGARRGKGLSPVHQGGRG